MNEIRKRCIGFRETWGRCKEDASGERMHRLFCDACDRRRVAYERQAREKEEAIMKAPR